MKALPLLGLIGCALLALTASTPALGFSFPALEGKFHNPQGINLDGAKISLEAKCSDPAGGDCGKAKATASIRVGTGGFRFAALSVGPSSRTLDYFKYGWGHRVDFRFKITLAGSAPVIVDNLHYWAWEGRPGSRLSDMVSTMKMDLAHLNLFPVSGSHDIVVSGELPSDAGQPRDDKRFYHFHFNRQFLPASDAPKGTTAQVVSRWFSYSSDAKAQPGEDLSMAFQLPPMIAVVPGAPALFGSSPRVRTLVHFYFERAPRGGERGLSYVPYGVLDVEEPYSPKYNWSSSGLIPVRKVLPDER